MKTNQNIPPYLGFGMLDKQSIRKEGEWMRANYTFNNTAILEVAISDKKAIYTDMWDGIKMSSSEYPTLQEAFINHYQFIDYTRLPVFEYLARLVRNTANIHFVTYGNKENQVMFFPALLLMRFRIPLTEKLFWHAKTLIQEDQFIDFFHNLYPSEIHLTKLDWSLIKIDIHILEFMTPMAKVYEFAQWLKNHGLIQPETHLQVILEPWSDEKDELRCFPAKEYDDWDLYEIQLKGKHKEASNK
jgi:hypothetical protein